MHYAIVYDFWALLSYAKTIFFSHSVSLTDNTNHAISVPRARGLLLLASRARRSISTSPGEDFSTLSDCGFLALNPLHQESVTDWYTGNSLKLVHMIRADECMVFLPSHMLPIVLVIF